MTYVDVASRTPNNLLPALRAAVADGNTIECGRNAGSWSCSTASEGGSRDAQSDGSGSVLAQRRSAPAARSNRTSRRGSTASVSSGPARRHLLALRVGGMPDDMILELTNLGSADLASLSSFKRTETTNGIAKAILAVTFHPSHGRVMTLGVGPQRRIRALVAMGYSVHALSELTGLTVHKLSTLPSDQLVPTAVWHVINDVYEHLSMTPGPDEQGRDAAREEGWATPLAWDDDEIDNPRARPHSPRRRRRRGLPQAVRRQEALADIGRARSNRRNRSPTPLVRRAPRRRTRDRTRLGDTEGRSLPSSHVRARCALAE